jgi:hypothetical protein
MKKAILALLIMFALFSTINPNINGHGHDHDDDDDDDGCHAFWHFG